MRIYITVDQGFVRGIEADCPESLEVIVLDQDSKRDRDPDDDGESYWPRADAMTPEHAERFNVAPEPEPGKLHTSCDGDVETTDLDRCPACGASAEDAGYGEVVIEPGCAIQDGDCTECGARWHDVYGKPVRILDDAGLAGRPEK
jgi:hypothetical protein